MQVDQITGEIEEVREEIQMGEVVVPQLIQVDSTGGEPNASTPDLRGVSLADATDLIDELDEPENILVEPTQLESDFATEKYRAAIQVPPESYGDNPDVQGGY